MEEGEVAASSEEVILQNALSACVDVPSCRVPGHEIIFTVIVVGFSQICGDSLFDTCVGFASIVLMLDRREREGWKRRTGGRGKLEEVIRKT